jgi:hypothetical protein
MSANPVPRAGQWVSGATRKRLSLLAREYGFLLSFRKRLDTETDLSEDLFEQFWLAPVDIVSDQRAMNALDDDEWLDWICITEDELPLALGVREVGPQGVRVTFDVEETSLDELRDLANRVQWFDDIADVVEALRRIKESRQ